MKYSEIKEFETNNKAITERLKAHYYLNALEQVQPGSRYLMRREFFTGAFLDTLDDPKMRDFIFERMGLQIGEPMGNA